MNWKEAGKKIVALGAPVLGTLLGGPAGGAIGTVVASAFGADPADPGDLVHKMDADPEAAVKLKEIEARHRERLEEIGLMRARLLVEQETATVRAVNATMQSEGKSEHWPQYSWRPFWGFSSGLAFLAVCVLVSILAFRAVALADAAAMAMIPQVITSFTTLFTIAGAVLGIAAWGRNRLKLTRENPGQALPGPKEKA